MSCAFQSTQPGHGGRGQCPAPRFAGGIHLMSLLGQRNFYSKRGGEGGGRRSDEHASAGTNSSLHPQITAQSSLFSPRSAQRKRASRCALPINLPLAAHSHARGMFAAQIPIAEHAARPTERTSRDFALALFGRRPSERVDSSSLPASENLHTKYLHKADMCSAAKNANRSPRRFARARLVKAKAPAPVLSCC